MSDIVVPARDEEATIGDVIDACLGAPSAGFVIVIANGCTDSTAQVAAAHGAFVVVSDKADKGAAMAEGLRWVDTDTVLFCDADLVGLTSDHIEGLLTLPPLNGQLAGLVDTPVSGLARCLPPITGERRLPTAFARRVGLSGSGYEAELRIDAAVGKAGLPHRTVVLRGVSNPTGAVATPRRFASMSLSVLAASTYLLPELLRYEVNGANRPA